MPTYKLKELVTEVISGEWGQDPSDELSGVKVIRTTNFSNTGRLDLHKEVVTREIEPQKVDKKKLIVGDIIIEKSGGSPEQPVGRVVFFEETGIYLCNNFTSILRPNTKLVEPKYLVYLMFNLHRTRRVLKFQNKTTGIINLKLEQYLEQTEVVIPSKEVQQKIVKVLDITFDLINKRQSQIAALDELTQSVFLEMFGDPVANSKGWDIAFCKDITKKIGSGSTPKGGNASYKDSGISLIRSLNVHNNNFTYKDLAFIDDGQAEKLKNVEVQENDILLNITGASVARSCIVPNNILPARVNQHVSIIRVKENIVSYIFLSNLFTNKVYQRYLWQIATNGGATREAITKQQIENLSIILPPLNLQNEFANKIKQIEKQRTLIQSSKVKLEGMYNSLLQKAFKGELFQQ